MAENIGVYPLDSTSGVGKFRLATGDVVSVPLDPPQVGYQSYTINSDAEIEQFLLMGSDSTNAAIGYMYLAQSGAAARLSKSVADYDLKVDLTKRSEDLRKTALFYFDRADIDDYNAGLAEAFEIVPTGNPEPLYPAEGEFPPYDPYPPLNPWVL